MMGEDGQWLTGYGANATDEKIRQKRIEHQLYQGYDVFNFHNQYIQFFAEIGIIGFIICIIMVFVNLKIAINRKDFVHFSFAILIISLFLTESFLARQRGVIYFTLMYCLFMSFSPKGNIKKLL
jgi:O-antigen ligase